MRESFENRRQEQARIPARRKFSLFESLSGSFGSHQETAERPSPERQSSVARAKLDPRLHASDAAIQIAGESKCCAKAHLGLGVAGVKFDGLFQDFRAAIGIAEIRNSATGVAQNLGAAAIVSDRELGGGNGLFVE